MPEPNEIAWYWKLVLILLQLWEKWTRRQKRKPTPQKPKRKSSKQQKPKAETPKPKKRTTTKPKPKKRKD